MQKVLHCRQCQYTGCEFRSFSKTASCFSGVARTTRCCSSWYLGMCVLAVFPYHTEDESVLLSYSHLWILSNLWFCDDHFEHARKAAITRGPLCDYLHLACIARHCISLKRLCKGVRQLGIYRYTFEMPRTADFEDFQYQHSFFMVTRLTWFRCTCRKVERNGRCLCPFPSWRASVLTADEWDGCWFALRAFPMWIYVYIALTLIWQLRLQPATLLV